MAVEDLWLKTHLVLVPWGDLRPGQQLKNEGNSIVVVVRKMIAILAAVCSEVRDHVFVFGLSHHTMACVVSACAYSGPQGPRPRTSAPISSKNYSASSFPDLWKLMAEEYIFPDDGLTVKALLTLSH